MYSKAWKKVKKTARIIVNKRDQTASFLLPAVIEWCE